MYVALENKKKENSFIRNPSIQKRKNNKRGFGFLNNYNQNIMQRKKENSLSSYPREMYRMDVSVKNKEDIERSNYIAPNKINLQHTSSCLQLASDVKKAISENTGLENIKGLGLIKLKELHQELGQGKYNISDKNRIKHQELAKNLSRFNMLVTRQYNSEEIWQNTIRIAQEIIFDKIHVWLQETSSDERKDLLEQTLAQCSEYLQYYGLHYSNTPIDARSFSTGSKMANEKIQHTIGVTRGRIDAAKYFMKDTLDGALSELTDYTKELSQGEKKKEIHTKIIQQVPKISQEINKIYDLLLNIGEILIEKSGKADDQRLVRKQKQIVVGGDLKSGHDSTEISGLNPISRFMAYKQLGEERKLSSLSDLMKEVGNVGELLVNKYNVYHNTLTIINAPVAAGLLKNDENLVPNT